MVDAYNLEFFNVTFPAEYVAHVEINRPEKMNAFKEVYVLHSFYNHSPPRTFTVPRYTPTSL
jgi:1,4-dihydroxy-2-naphthoyl-CoA synthase